MATVEEFHSFIKNMPKEIESSRLSADALYDSKVMAERLTESAQLGELDGVTKDISIDSLEVLSSGSYTDPENFQDDYSKLPINDRRKMEDELYSNDAKGVDEFMVKMTAKAVSNEYDLTKAKTIIDGYNKSKLSVEDIKDRKFQQAVSVCRNYNEAYALNQLHLNFDKFCERFNAKWFKGIGKLTKGHDRYSASPMTPYPDVATTNLKQYSNAWVAAQPMTDEEKVNHAVALKARLAMLGYPLDYTWKQPKGAEGVEDVYPIIAAMMSGATLPTTGAKVAYGVAGGFMDPLLTTGMEELGESIGEFSAPLGVISSVGAVLILGPLSEAFVANTLMRTSKKMFMLPGNTLQKMLKFSSWEDIKLTDDTYDFVDGIISNPESRFKRLLPEGDEAQYKLPQTMYNDNDIEIVNIDPKDLGRVKKEINILNRNDTKKHIKEELDRRTFLPQKEKAKLAFKEGNVEEGLQAISDHVDYAVDQSYRMFDGTDTVIADIKTNPVHSAYFGVMPESMKSSTLYNVNKAASLEDAVADTMNTYATFLESKIGKFKFQRREFNSVMNRLDSEEIKLADVLEAESLSARTKEGLQLYKKYNDHMYDTLNPHFSKQMNDAGIKQVGDAHVNVLRTTDDGTVVQELVSKKEYIVTNPDDIKDVSKAFKKRDYFMHRFIASNKPAVSILKDGVMKTVDTYKNMGSAYKIKNELIKSGKAGDADIIVHRIKDRPDRILREYKGSSIGVPQSRIEEVINDSDLLTQIMLDNGIMSAVDRVELIGDIVGKLSSNYGIGNLRKKLLPKGAPANVRTRPKGLSGVEDAITCLRAYNKSNAAGVITGPYLTKYKKEILEIYGGILEDPKNFNSKIDYDKLKDPKFKHLNAKAAMLYQNGLVNMSRIPHPRTIKFQQRIDDKIYKIYNSESKLFYPYAKALESIRDVKWSGNLKAFGAVQALTGLSMLPTQASFMSFGILKHIGTDITHIKNLPAITKSTSTISTHMLRKQMGLPEMVKLSNWDQQLVKHMEDMGIVSNVLGTEGGTAGGLFSGVTKVLTLPTSTGEMMNRIGNAVNSAKAAEKLGKKIGTPEFAEFLATDVPKNAQILSHASNAPFTADPLLSWNVAQFKKFPIQAAMQHYGSGTTVRQKLLLGAAGIGLYGMAGMPFLGELSWLANNINDRRSQLMLDTQLNVSAAAENITIEDADKFLEKKYKDDPKELALQKIIIRNSFSEREKLKDTIGNIKVNDLLKDKYDPNRPANGWDIYSAIINYEGYFDNPLISLGYRSILEQADDYSLWSLGGTILNAASKADFLNTMVRLHDDMSKYTYGEMTWEDMSSNAKAEGRRLFAAMFPSMSSNLDMGLQFEEVVGAINKHELYDEEGNLFDWATIHKNPNIKWEVAYTKQSGTSLAPTEILKDTTFPELGLRLIGLKGERIRKASKEYQDSSRHINNVIKPTIKMVADRYDYYISKGETELATNLLAATSANYRHKWIGSPMYSKIMAMLEREVELANYKRTVRASTYNEIERENISKFEKSMGDLYNVR